MLRASSSAVVQDVLGPAQRRLRIAHRFGLLFGLGGLSGTGGVAG
jgi:hypothetical protein